MDFTIETVYENDVTGNLRCFQPLDIVLVNGTEQERIWDQSVRCDHYMGYCKMYGPRIKYLVMHREQPLAAISYNRAALKVDVRGPLHQLG